MSDKKTIKEAEAVIFERAAIIANQWAGFQTNEIVKETLQNLAVCYAELAESQRE